MGSPGILDFEALLAALPGERPAGDWLPDVHGAIERARRADDDLPQGDWKREVKTADWTGVIKIATEALATRTKDLKAAVFLVEAVVKQHGIPGARDGLRLVRELQERFWESLHPEIDDGDLDGRIAPLEWLDGRLSASLKEIAVALTRDGRAYSLLQWDEARAIERLKPEAREEALADGKVTVEQLNKAVAATPRIFYEVLIADLDATSEELKSLGRTIDEKFGREAPGLLEIRKALEECRDVVQPILKRKRELEPAATPAEQPSSEPLLPTEHTTVADGPIDPVSRADALHRLTAIATFFRRSEPHSPVAYLVERAIHWGRLPLDQWLREVIHDDGVLAHVRETLGLPHPQPGGDEGDKPS
jgi:type VI secretion system protein ImpA